MSTRLSAALLPCLLGACASWNPPAMSPSTQLQNRVQLLAPQAEVQLHSQPTTQALAAERAQQLISSGELSEQDAVRVALLLSPRIQTVLARYERDLALAFQEGQLPNPTFTFERLRLLEELEWGRLLGINLTRLLTWPARQALAERLADQLRLKLEADLLQELMEVRLAWGRWVAARELKDYAKQVQDSAQASAELARRMQRAGNLSVLAQARQHSFYADATLSLAQAEITEQDRRHAFLRLLGIPQTLYSNVMVPGRLPALPDRLAQMGAVDQVLLMNRLDVRRAQAQLAVALQRAGLGKVDTWLNVHGALRRDSISNTGESGSLNRRGFEVDLQIPVFDWGQLRRQALQSAVLEAAMDYERTVREAASQLTQAQYNRAAYDDVAQYHAKELLPLRQRISEESQLRYNGMFISVFELLADARDAVSAVQKSLVAREQVFAAQIRWEAAQMGLNLNTAVPFAGSPSFTAPQNAVHGGH